MTAPRTRLPATLAVLTLGGCIPSSKECDVVEVPDASVRTYACADGRMCNPPNPDQMDGGEYQICPGLNGCSVIVTYDGTVLPGFC